MNMTNNWLTKDDSEFLAVLRSLSIFVIVFGHVGGFWFYPPWTEFLHVFVPVFFFLSGAVSYNAFLKSANSSEYLKKRTTGLLVPYYCICLFALAIFVLQKQAFPDFNLSNLVKWITMLPSRDISPFPLGQVWFLHTLFIISLVSPILFTLYEKNKYFLVFIIIFSVTMSTIQINHNIADHFIIYGHHLFKPIVHTIFYSLGFMVIDTPSLRSRNFSLSTSLLFLLASIFLVYILKLNPDYAEHTYSPDLYYVTGSLSAIWALLFLQPYILKFYRNSHLFIRKIIDFFFKHTFAIYLLHTFSIFFVEKIFGLTNPQQKTISYGVIKLTVVFLITLILSPMFTKITSKIGNQILLKTSRPNNQLTQKFR